MITGELDRKIERAKAIIERLDSNAPLSHVLSPVRFLSNMTDDSVMVALVDILRFGLTNVPYQGIPFTDPAYRAAVLEHIKLCGVEDFSETSVDEVVDGLIRKGLRRDTIPQKALVVPFSVHEMENMRLPPDPVFGTRRDLLNVAYQQRKAFDETRSILARLRAYIYDYVSRIWIEATREKERIDLLGPDYRLITDRLDALESPVGGELIAAIDNLASNNPAKWSLCALGCRNIVIKLAMILWKVPVETYTTKDGTKLDVTKNKEKNRLYAYIDTCSSKVTSEKQALLDQAKDLVRSIHEKGSKGKRAIRHNEAQTLVIDTFRLIDLLDEATSLESVEALLG